MSSSPIDFAPAGTDDDAALLRALRSADVQVSATAFRAIFLRHGPALGVHLRGRVDDDTAKDIGQDLMADLWERRGKLTITGSLRHYLIAAATRQVAHHYRSCQVAEEYLRTRGQSGRTSVENDAIEELMRQELDGVIAKVNAKASEQSVVAFTLSFYRGYAAAEIARELNIAVSTVYRLLQERWKHLEAAILKKGIFDAKDVNTFIANYDLTRENRYRHYA